MKRMPWLIATLALLATPLAAAERVELAPGEDAYTLRLLQSDRQHTVLRLDLLHFDVETVSIAGEEYARLALGRRALLQEKGMPALPVIRESLLIPDDAAMQLRILDAEYREFEGMAIAPSKGNLSRQLDPAQVPYEFADFYGEDAWYPAANAALDRPYIMRDPARQTLRVCTSITVSVGAAGPGLENVLTSRPAARTTEFEKVYARHYLNYAAAAADRYDSVPEAGSMMVICYDAFRSAAMPFVNWKNQMGIKTEIVDVSSVGATGAQVKAFLQDCYDNDGVCFIVLVGDAAQVPYYNNGGASDPSYTLLAGADDYPDAFVGRMSAENLTDVQTQVERSVEYERDAQALAGWYHSGVGIASNQGPGDDGEYDNEHMDVIRGKLLGFTYTGVDQIYDPSGTAAMVANALNEGRSIINYCGHGSMTSWGSTGFSNTNVNALVNDNKLPFIFSVACNNGEFQSGTCFAEAWLRATHNGEPTGAVAMYGSTISQSWDPPMCAEDEYVDLLTAEVKRCYGALTFNGSCQMIDEYAASGFNEFKFWTVFGDPSLRVRTDTPSAVFASHLGFVDPTAAGYDVDTDPGNLVAVSYQGSFIGSVVADAGGNAYVPFDGPLPNPGENVTLTITGFNRFAHTEELLVGAETLGFIAGDVSNASNGGTSVAGVEICLVESDQFFFSQSNGHYNGGALEGTFTVTARHESFETVTAYDVAVVRDETTILDFALVDVMGPAIANTTQLPPTEDQVGPYMVSANLTDFSAIAEMKLRWYVDGIEYHEADLTLVDPATGLCEAGIDGAWWNSRIDYWIDATDTAGNSSRDPEFGDYTFWVLQSFTIFEDAMEADLGWTVGATGDNATAGIWTRVDPIGVFEGAYEVQPEDDYTEAGTLCFITGNGETGAQGADDVDGGKTTLLSPWFDLEGNFGVSVSYRRWYTNDTGNNPGGDIWVVEVTNDGSDWVILENTNVSDRSWAERSFLLDDFVAPTSTVRFRFVASDESPGSVVEAGVDEFRLIGFQLPVTAGPASVPVAAAALEQNHPNPFNPKTAIRFALREAGDVTLAIFDVGGRRVRTLADGPLAAGRHEAIWDGRDETGGELASGVYFYRLRAEGVKLSRRMLLLK